MAKDRRAELRKAVDNTMDETGKKFDRETVESLSASFPPKKYN